jgi:hypothetical protein
MDVVELEDLFTRYNRLKHTIRDLLREKTNCMVVITDMSVSGDSIVVEFDEWSDSRCYSHSALVDIDEMRVVLVN